MGRESVLGMRRRVGLGLESEEGDVVPDEGVKRCFCGEGGLVVSLRLRIPRGRKGDMVVVVAVSEWWGVYWKRDWKKRWREGVVCSFRACHRGVSR